MSLARKMLPVQRSHEQLAQTPAIPQDKSSPRPPEAKSKVKAYIKEMKQNDERGSKMGKPRQILALSLEDLYQISDGHSLSPETAKKELRTTLRIIKEKEITILKLREACHELTLKYADAENTIDQLRFGILPGGMRRSKSEFNVAKGKAETKDQATETKDEVLSESCSNWMEKVQNWKTDSTFNASADADSGFRGSELETRSKKASLLERASSKQEHTLQTVGTNTDDQSSRQLPIIKSQSYHDINYTLSSVSIRSGSHERSLDNAHNRHRRLSAAHFQTLEPLLDEATVLARRVQTKSRRLAKMINCADKKV